MKILMPVDGSEHTQKAINFFLDHKQSFGKYGSATLLHVTVPLPKLLGVTLPRSAVEGHYANAVKEAMHWAQQRFAQYEVACAEEVEIGDPAAKIGAVAEHDQYDLIIMGSRGHGGVPGLALGSTALKVLGACKVPVLIVR